MEAPSLGSACPQIKGNRISLNDVENFSFISSNVRYLNCYSMHVLDLTGNLKYLSCQEIMRF